MGGLCGKVVPQQEPTWDMNPEGIVSPGNGNVSIYQSSRKCSWEIITRDDTY